MSTAGMVTQSVTSDGIFERHAFPHSYKNYFNET